MFIKFGNKLPKPPEHSKQPSFVCRYCGQIGSSHITRDHCNRSFSKKHEIIPESKIYACKYCGQSGPNPHFAIASCGYGPEHRHCLITGKDLYVCKYCGYSSSTPNFALMSCPSPTSPNHRHELAD